MYSFCRVITIILRKLITMKAIITTRIMETIMLGTRMEAIIKTTGKIATMVVAIIDIIQKLIGMGIINST